MAKAGAANFLMNFTAKPTTWEIVMKWSAAFVCRRFLSKHLRGKIKTFCIGGNHIPVNFQTYRRWLGNFWPPQPRYFLLLERCMMILRRALRRKLWNTCYDFENLPRCLIFFHIRIYKKKERNPLQEGM